MPKVKYFSSGEFFYAPKGTFLKSDLHGPGEKPSLTIDDLQELTGVKERSRFRWHGWLGFFPKPRRKKWYHKKRRNHAGA